jgi:hypothetical protein
MVSKFICEIYGGITRTPIIEEPSGLVRHPENTIVLTKDRIFILSIPYQGYNLRGISSVSDYLLRDSIKEKALQIFKKEGAESLVKSNPKENYCFNLNEIKVKMKKPLWGFLLGNRFIIYTPQGKKTYVIYKKDDFERLGEIFNS